MSEQDGSQTVETQTASPDAQKSAVDDWRTAFGLPSEQQQKEPEQDTHEPEKKEEPAAIQEQPKPEDKKGITVKFNKEERFVDETDIPDFVQKGLALEKERERRGEYEKALDRSAKLQGFKDHAELIANLDRIEKEREEAQQKQYDELQEKMITELEYNGISREDAIAYLQNNPVLQQAKKALEESETLKTQQEQAKSQQEVNRKWSELYETFPDLIESAKVFNDGGRPDWYTPEMEARIQREYDPVDAYRLAHADKLQTQTKKQTEQAMIKQQQLGKRAEVETVTPADDTPEVPDSVKSAFSMFGLDPRRAAKHFKK